MSEKEKDTELFRVALGAASNTDTMAYLGNPQVVESILRMGALEVFQGLSGKQPTQVEDFVYQIAIKTMKPFLGEDRNYKPLPGWNKKGAIDTFIAKWVGIDEMLPLARLAGAFIHMISELMDIENYASVSGVKDEEWNFQVEGIFTWYTRLLLGVSPPQQALL